MEATKQSRGMVRIDENECKGCGLCIEACPQHRPSASEKVLRLSERLNHYGYRTAVYAGDGCTGCGICFMVCPEPGAITVLRAAKQGTALAIEVNEGAVACASN